MTSNTRPRGVFALVTLLTGPVAWGPGRRMGPQGNAQPAPGFGRNPAQAT